MESGSPEKVLIIHMNSWQFNVMSFYCIQIMLYDSQVAFFLQKFMKIIRESAYFAALV